MGSKDGASGESNRLPPMWSRFKPRCEYHMWVEFVVHSRLCSERFFGVFQFSPLLKNQHFQIPIRPRMVVKDLNHYVCGLLSVNSQGLLHPVTRRSCRSHWQSFIPLQTSLSSVNRSFFSRTIIQWNNLLASVFSKHCSLDTFKAQAAAIIYLFISLLHCT